MDYSLRGKCKEMCDELIKKDPSLKLVRGHYYDPIWNSDQQHWWCVDRKGEIVDPTADQFPSGGIPEFYVEFNGVCECSECGKNILEENAKFESGYSFCSGTCYGKFVGLL